MRKLEKVAIANRGEVAVRIIRACQELGIQTVLLHSDADKNSMAYRICDEAICIGPAPVGESYLNIDNNIQGALSVGADAIHPGFGFLSENADFAKACEENRLIFIGPSPECINLFGDKISAKKLVESTGAPTIPGYQGEDQSIDNLIQEAEKIGYPAIVKAAAGGGGRGLRVILSKEKSKEAIEAAQREGLSAFGSSTVFLEKYLDRAKHIEVQIFVDAGGKVYHLAERECSIQRRHQKIIEEAPSASLPDEIRKKILKAAVDIAEKANYLGAGTVEFLYQDNQFFFLEMNTRLQVEHPVTEMVLNIDLVKAQIQTAAEQSLLWDQECLSTRGHAIECRIYAEDPYMKGMPSTGKMGHCKFPSGPGRRFESGFEDGDLITSNYDPMIAKVVVWDENRPRAIQKMIVTLEQTIIFGLKTNIPYLLDILRHHEFADSSMNTRFIETHYPNGLQPEAKNQDAVALGALVHQGLAEDVGESKTSHPSPWSYVWEGS